MDMVETIYEIVANPYAYAREWEKAERRKVVGYFCSYTPEEIILAAGALLEEQLTVWVEEHDRDGAVQTALATVSGELAEGANGAVLFVDESDLLGGVRHPSQYMRSASC